MMQTSTRTRVRRDTLSVLVADDDPVTLRIITSSLSRSGHEIITAVDGVKALELLRSPGAPRIAILDWMMPELDGIDVCRELRREGGPYTYVVLLTSRERRSDLIAGLEAGADDYLTKPFDPSELRCRIRNGERILRLQQNLERNVSELEEALAHVKRLQGLLPICMHCKSVRDDGNAWHRIEAYLEEYSGLMVTHSLCEECLEKHYPEFATEEMDRPNPQDY